MPEHDNKPGKYDAPRENFARGILEARIPQLGPAQHGKVRDIWTDGNKRIMVTTDRQSAFDRIIGTIPGKGAVLNLASGFWLDWVDANIGGVRSHAVDIPHPNVLIAEEAKATLPVEVVLRRHMARSSTTTSIYRNYAEGRRNIYGIDFPDGLAANQAFPQDLGENGIIITPTTKANAGHDEELTDEKARELVDSQLGNGLWGETKRVAYTLYQAAYDYCKEKGLILVDTKYEFGLDESGGLMIIDEVHTPDSSRFWLSEFYDEEAIRRGDITPRSFDKEILRNWLSEQGFTGEGQIPTTTPEIIDRMAEAYTVPYKMITGKEVPNPIQKVVSIKNPFSTGLLEVHL